MNPPKKEVIYVDIEDDITAVIEKVKSASAGIVALVPPKRIGMLQSIVNLKLLSRAADQYKKRLVLITNDSALSSLAAGVSIPVAKNLQTKPELAAPAPQVTDSEEVIDGETLPVGSHAGLPDEVAESPAVVSAVSSIAAEKATQTAPKKKDTKIPNLDAFKKKVLLIGGGAALLIGFFVWAIWFAPQATVTIAAKTTPYNVSDEVTARQNAELDTEEGVLPLVVASKKQTNSADFTATGKKNVGQKATGTIEFVNDGISSRSVPAGTELESSSGLVFITDGSITVDGASLGNCDGRACIVPGSETVQVTAADRGSKYNGASGDVSGEPNSLSASFTDASTGGTDKTETVVSDADVEKAREQVEIPDEKELRAELEKEFEDDDVIIIDESFRVNSANPSVSPAVGERANNASLSVETTYQLVAVEKSDVQALIEANVKEQLEGLSDQKIYKFGVEDVRFTRLSISDGSYKFTMTTTAYAGPEINPDEVAKDLVGKVEGEIQEAVKARGGVESVEVDFSPFWVNSVSSEDKITIRFDIENVE